MQKKMGLVGQFATWLYWKAVFKPLLDEQKQEAITIHPDDPHWIQLQRERQFSELH